VFFAVLAASCEKAPSAAFDMPSAIYSGEDFTFTNTSTNSDSYTWDFGDGNESTEMNPTHSYLDVGNYTVTLKATKAGESSEITKTVTVLQGTQLHLNVMYDGTTTPAANFEIQLFDSYNDWFNETNSLLESTTDAYGKIDIVGVSSIVYYIDAYKAGTSGYWANWTLGYMTDALTLHQINNYNVYVEYTAYKKTGEKENYKITKIESASSNPQLKLESLSTESASKVVYKLK